MPTQRKVDALKSFQALAWIVRTWGSPSAVSTALRLQPRRMAFTEQLPLRGTGRTSIFGAPTGMLAVGVRWSRPLLTGACHIGRADALQRKTITDTLCDDASQSLRECNTCVTRRQRWQFDESIRDLASP